MNVRNWLVQTARYYRQYDFFRQYSLLSDEELADELEALCREEAGYTGGTFNGRGDWEVICYDYQRTLGMELDALYGDDPGTYSFQNAIWTMQEWATISRGKFLPLNIRDVGEYLVELKLDGSWHTLNPWEDPYKLAPQINPLIAKTGFQFEIWDLYPSCLVAILTSEEKQKFQFERGWRFI
ncbi:MAG: hypothetical protein F6K00_01355 [Leptolyngbya sp. SIOISBB]|nr:hypothetical protein [Leptolyngbya sp. SIOISBB]